MNSKKSHAAPKQDADRLPAQLNQFIILNEDQVPQRDQLVKTSGFSQAQVIDLSLMLGTGGLENECKRNQLDIGESVNAILGAKHYILNRYFFPRLPRKERLSGDDVLVIQTPMASWLHQALVYVQTHPELDHCNSDELYAATMDVIHSWMLIQEGDRKLDAKLYRSVCHVLTGVYTALNELILRRRNHIRAFYYNNRLQRLIVEYTPETTDVLNT
jgi:hypothetical protein